MNDIPPEATRPPQAATPWSYKLDHAFDEMFAGEKEQLQEDGLDRHRL